MNVYAQKKKLFLQWSEELLDPVKGMPNYWLPALKYMVDANYYGAPASTKYHLCIEGGLLIHSVCVTELALRMHGIMPINIPRDFILAAGLLHDIGKCGLFYNDECQPRYVKNPKYNAHSESKWNPPYEYRGSDPEFNTRDLSGLLVARWGFPWPVVQAVLIHDGAYVPANADYAQRGGVLAGLLMAADTAHAQQFETKDGVILFEEKKA